MQQFVRLWIHLFFVFGIVFVPAAFKLFAFQNELAPFCFGWISQLFDLRLADFSSDSSGLYFLLPTLLFMAALIGGLLVKILKSSQQSQLIQLLRVILVYYLASRMLTYGVDKIVSMQFYTPEPNTLYTPFGFMTKDILYWSVMGTSKAYLIFMGLIEIIPAILLLFRKTRLFGLVILLLVMGNVLMINVGFDISVKLYAFFLFSMIVVLISPQFRPIYRFFLGEQSNLEKPTDLLIFPTWLKASLKCFVVGLIFIESVYIVWVVQDAAAAENESAELYGAFEINSEQSHLSEVKRVFVHRANYLIFQTDFDAFADYKLTVREDWQQFILEDYAQNLNTITYELYENTLTLQGTMLGCDEALQFNRQAHLNLPALQDDFHWTTESFGEGQ